VYRPGRSVEELLNLDHIEDESPEGFRLDLTEIYQSL